MNFENVEVLNDFVDRVNEHLCDAANHKEVVYLSSKITPWDSDAIQDDNELILESVSGSANIYAIFCSEPDKEDYALSYIGKTTRKGARQRIRNHLIKKHERTGAKLEMVMEHLQVGGKIGIVRVKIEPESLRNYVEEELISRHPEARWNRENANRGN